MISATKQKQSENFTNNKIITRVRYNHTMTQNVRICDICFANTSKRLNDRIPNGHNCKTSELIS